MKIRKLISVSKQPPKMGVK